MRIIFSEVEKGLESDSEKKQLFEKYLKGKIENYITCMNCNTKKTRVEDFYEIFLNV